MVEAKAEVGEGVGEGVGEVGVAEGEVHEQGGGQDEQPGGLFLCVPQRGVECGAKCFQLEGLVPGHGPGVGDCWHADEV